MRIFVPLAAMLVVVSPSAAASMSLVGVPWQLEVLSGARVSASVPPTLVIGHDGQVNGNGGCNGFSASALIGEGTLTFERMMSTTRACGQATLERRYFDVMATVVGYSIDEETLTLRDAAGVDVATFSPQYVQ